MSVAQRLAAVPVVATVAELLRRGEMGETVASDQRGTKVCGGNRRTSDANRGSAARPRLPPVGST